MPQLSESVVIEACRTLFGSHLTYGRDFLWYLQRSGAKSAYRIRAKETHPDRFGGSLPADRQDQARMFREIRHAYDVICTFFDQRERGLWRPAPVSASRPAGGYRSATKERKGGTVPDFRLEFGLYLYFRGAITYGQMIAAIVWQRRHRPLIGDLARRWHWLSDGDVDRIMTTRGPSGRFGQRAEHLGLLSPLQVRALLRYQDTLNRRLGQYFVEQGILSADEVERLVEEMHLHNARFPRR